MLRSELPTANEVRQWLKKGFPLVKMGSSQISLKTCLPSGNDKIEIINNLHDLI